MMAYLDKNRDGRCDKKEFMDYYTHVGASIDSKSASRRKSGFSLPYSKTNGLSRKSGVWRLHFRDRNRANSGGKTEFEFDIDVCSSFWGFGGILEPIWEPPVRFKVPLNLGRFKVPLNIRH